MQSASNPVQGTVYNPPTYNDTGKTCPYPIEATTALTCPRQLYADSQKGPAIVFMDDPEPPPNVLATISLLQFEGIDQALLTFTVTPLANTYRSSHAEAHSQPSLTIPTITQLHATTIPPLTCSHSANQARLHPSITPVSLRVQMCLVTLEAFPDSLQHLSGVG